MKQNFEIKIFFLNFKKMGLKIQQKIIKSLFLDQKTFKNFENICF